MIANSLDLEVGKFVHQVGDLHYYDRHEEVLLSQVRTDETYDQPTLEIEGRDFFDYGFNDIKLINYVSGESRRYEVAI